MKLIFDIGSNNGDDIQYYLHKADLVVAVEANPKLCNLISKRFNKEIKDKRLFIENAAISDCNNKETIFYINKKNDHVSSIVPELHDQSNNLENWERLTVKTITFIDLLNKYGKPDYIKIDIEGADNIFLTQLLNSKFKPKYISAECHNLDVFSTLSEKLEYKTFNLVEGWNVDKIYKKKRIFSLYLKKFINYSFPLNSAGPFGKDINGKWYDKQSFLKLLALKKIGWRDIHATNEFSGEEITVFEMIYILLIDVAKKSIKFIFFRVKKPFIETKRFFQN